ncbi:DUF3857 domain-containing transglutaminase family protein [Proteus mirabilis]|uniref:DUF3857 domain-containing transglutaminase family protein n=1 Tax=Proteus mirabilis TaxID=584 RepID=UPI00234AE7E6|nr:DUF3857 and transglutaminase domain-containing protein [Proteus mirabilis]MDC5886277.1 DUF3857 and transglutaminase domain-containing protein [Proteus mirabilis]MDC5903874.1 DUF3857 and transglutaminase domain-containing protein [Proteus mirabilis]MDC5907422.1 DUF3857 and transglutaminase domain-containing protein [Proteus mirabilis]MDC5921529.1 DUF3857 and transglutaminase domain-containing protein [Proteus mirabilis]MDC5932053.1 DUF3857 and transglutaminase domain-containing protein [Prot
MKNYLFLKYVIIRLMISCLLSSLIVALPVLATPSNQPDLADNDFSYVHFRADYKVNDNATSTKIENYEILLKTKSAVDQFSQIRLGYSEKMETLKILAAYTLTPDGQRHDVPAENIYIQESYSSANAPLYADRKVRVIVFPQLTPGSRLVYQIQKTQHIPYFPGYFGLWETFSVFDQYDKAEVNLQAPAKLPLKIYTRGVEGQDKPQIKNGLAHWQWRYSRSKPMKVQTWSAQNWTFSPTIMASTYHDWSQLAKAYQFKSNIAAKVTPEIKKLANDITMGISDRRKQAEALYHWVAKNIRYVAVYLGNGGLEPNLAQDILNNHYGDCKDHVVLLEALLAAKGIESSPALIGMDNGPILPDVPLIDQFNHVITYLPEFNLYIDPTVPFARFGQLPEGASPGYPILLTRYAKLARIPSRDEQSIKKEISVNFEFDILGNMKGKTVNKLSEIEEIGLRDYFSQFNLQNRERIESHIMSDSDIDGSGQLVMDVDPEDLKKRFGFSFIFKADDYIDFNNMGAITIPKPPGGKSFRVLHTKTLAPTNQTPFYCTKQIHEETYHLQLPNNISIVSVPKDQQFRNVAGDYQVKWQRNGQKVTVNHRLHLNAIHGEEALCQPQDYLAFRELFQQVRRGFRGQVVYGEPINN